ncbi:hypothetical protein Bbelb_410080 [Branchiostoma belcheri]|nr:hypothetical protein Bbelb_410080 [Branchiostoma belcheri]
MADGRAAMLFLVVVHLVIALGGGEEVYSAPGGDGMTDLTCSDDIGNTFKDGDTVWLDFGSRKCVCEKGKEQTPSNAEIEWTLVQEYCVIGCHSDDLQLLLTNKCMVPDDIFFAKSKRVPFTVTGVPESPRKLTGCSAAYECPPVPKDCVETRDIPDYCTVCTKRGCKSPTKGKYLSIGETHIQEKACLRCECVEGGTLQCSDMPGCA